MIQSIINFITGGLVDKVFDLVKSYQNRQLSEAELRAEVEKKVAEVVADVAKDQRDVIIAELKSEDWLTRNWRPIVALSFSFVLLWYALLVPILVDWVGTPPLRPGDLMLNWTFTICMACVTGYVGGRSLEKIVGKLTGRR